MNVRQLPPGTSLVEFGQLSDDSKSKARAEVLAIDELAYRQSLDECRSKLKQNINVCVNDRHFLSRLLRRRKHINLISADTDRLDKYIMGNVCQFLPDGTYITYNY